MTSQSLWLLWISMGLIVLFFLAIMITWLVVNVQSAREKKALEALDERLASVLGTRGVERDQAMEQLLASVKGNKYRVRILIRCLVLKGQAFIVANEAELVSLYEETGITAHLIKSLQSKRDYTQALACRQIGELGLRGMEQHVMPLIQSNSNDVIYNVLLAFAKLGDMDSLSQALISHSRNIDLSYRVIVEIITNFEGDQELFFKETIDKSDDYMRGVLIKAAADCHLNGMADYYVKYVDSSNKNLRIACLRALGQLRDARYESCILKSLEDSEWEVRATAAKSLGTAGTVKSCEALEKLTSDSEWWVRHNAASALVLIPEGTEFVNRIVHGQDKFAREAVLSLMKV